MAHAKHPLIAAHRADAAPHLIGERLESEPVIRGGERAAQRVARSVGLLRGGENLDRLLETALEQLLVAVKRNLPAGFQLRARGQMEAMNRVEEKERADPLVEILAAAAEGVERVAFREQRLEARRRRRASSSERLRGGVVGRGDEIEEAERHGALLRREQFHEAAQHFVAILAGERERELRGEQAVFHAEVVAASVEFAGEVALLRGELREGGAEIHGRLVALRGGEHSPRMRCTAGVSTCMPKKQR